MRRGPAHVACRRLKEESRTVIQSNDGPLISDSLTSFAAARITKPSRSIDSLTGLRGVAAIWVFLTHFQLVLATYLEAPAILSNTLLYNGFRGVDLFFALSGFILTIVHGDDFKEFQYNKFRQFYILRFFRVYPLNAAILFILMPLAWALPGLVMWFRFDHGVPVPWHSSDFSAGGFIQSLFLAQTWTLVKPGEWNGPSWSLSAEVFGYAMFPFLAWALMRSRSALACVSYALASLTTLMILQAIFGHTQDSPIGTFGLVRMVCGFIAGMGLARVYQLAPGATWIGAPLALLSLLVIGLSLTMHAANMFVVFGFSGLILALSYQKGVINTAMSSKTAMFLGRISFSFYMVHYLILKISLWLLQTQYPGIGYPIRVLCLITVVLICVGIAMITHYLLELPLQAYARSILRHETDPRSKVDPVMKTA